MHRLFFSCFLMMIPFWLSAQADGPWTYYQSLEGRFSVEWPGEFRTKVDSVKTPLGLLAYHNFFYQNPKEEKGENMFYMISYCDYPAEAVHSDSTELVSEFFDATMEQAAKSVIGKVLYSDNIYIKDYPGRFFRINYLEDKAVIKTRAFLVENRYYTIQTISLAGNSLNKSTEYFFGSFKLVEE